MFGVLTLIIVSLAANPAAGEAQDGSGGGETTEEVPVTFVGGEIVELGDGEEVEVTFAEEVDLEGFGDLPPLPEYHEAPWLTALPVLCIALLAWNVRWKRGPRRHARK